MTNADTHQFITYTDRRPANIGQDTRPTNDIPGLQGVPGNQRPSNVTGTVDMQSYMNNRGQTTVLMINFGNFQLREKCHAAPRPLGFTERSASYHPAWQQPAGVFFRR
ncbi:MAG: hypothetical protein Q7V00_13135 [Sulfurimicrobium sp.]|nr:hypothetical protein [Sulfurimicrobium sp.]MDP1705473.1 hypothetical protein [Sulfurimicrobium sp.]MDP2198849.1 hypothetical protein [Sulfurimicrobium sp.]MDP3686889.1 hypothetical protein [Sulfurimicrobium sp.]